MDYKKIVVNWKEFEIPRILHRNKEVNLNADFIITLTGPRRAGKTYFCFQLMNKLISEGISKNNLLYINFEDNNLIGATAEDLDKLLETYLSLFENDTNQKTYLFLDEIHTVQNWDSWSRKIYDTHKEIKLVLTGSSSKMLSKEISTKLRGRVLNYEIFPLSFKEVLNWKDIPYNLKTISQSKDKLKIIKEFSEFILNGGYPALFIQNAEKDIILQSYYDSMILKDVVERYNIKDVNKLKAIANLIFGSVSREISYSKIANKLRSIGFTISKNTIISYISYFEEAYLFFQNLRYEYSIAKQLGSIKKVYCIDNGILNFVSFKFSEDYGKLIENMVFVELKRRGEEVYYHRDIYECDFLVVRKNKVSLAIQVTKKLDEINEKREISGLLEVIKKHKIRSGIILTEDQEEEKIIDGNKIILLPVWKWLLMGEK